MNLKQIIPVSILLICLSIGCFWSSKFFMEGYQDCWLDEPQAHHTIPAAPLPGNCASRIQLFSKTLLNYFGFALLSLSIVLPFFIDLQQRKSTGSEKLFTLK